MFQKNHLAMAVTALALSACANHDQPTSSVPMTSNSSSYSSNQTGSANNGGAASYKVPSPLDITTTTYPALLAVTCNYFNPDAIKALKPEVIRFMAEIFPSGINRYEHFMIARQLGFEGEFGQGEHNTWMDSQLGRRQAFENMVSLYANQSYAGIGFTTLRDHHLAARASGYEGVFLCGGHNCWIAGQCDSLGRRK